MYLFKRIFNILQADIINILDKTESKQNEHRSRSDEVDYEWFKYKDTYNKSDTSGYSNKKFRDAPTQDNKLAQYYANFNVPYGTDIDTVKREWRRLLKKCHPDLCTNDPVKMEMATELTIKLNTAYRELEKASVNQ